MLVENQNNRSSSNELIQKMNELDKMNNYELISHEVVKNYYLLYIEFFSRYKFLFIKCKFISCLYNLHTKFLNYTSI